MKLKLYLLFALITTVILQSCNPGKPGLWKNGEINKGKRDDFHKLNDQLFDAIKTNKIYNAEYLMSQSLLSDNDYHHTIELINLHSKLKGYTIIDEYYMVSDTTTTTHSLKNTTATDGTKYNFYCATVTPETYVVFIQPKSTADKYLMTAVYCKYDYGWRLNDLEWQPYTITKKTTPELYQQAKKYYNKGYIVDAFNTMVMAEKCAHPNTMWEYIQSTKMTEFNGMLVDVLNSYTFPLVMKDVASKPQIFQVTHLTTDEGVFPSIDYISNINLKDTVDLEKEKEAMKNVIGQSFPGIDKNKKYIYFTAFNEKPSATKNVAFFDMVGKLPWVDIK